MSSQIVTPVLFLSKENPFLIFAVCNFFEEVLQFNEVNISPGLIFKIHMIVLIHCIEKAVILPIHIVLLSVGGKLDA